MLETTGKPFSLTKMKGTPFVLYFYPRDNTPDCTQEGKDFASGYAKFKKMGIEVFGVSGDSIESHQKFKTKMNFPFELISDPDQELCKKFDVMKLKNMYGKKFIGIERSTFLIDAKGKTLKEWRKVKVKGHVDEVLLFAKDHL
jgi:thioredoxin-dependent peroxiredoxin